MGQSFKDLEAWQEGMALARDVYRVTANFPDHQLYSLTQQAQRAAISIPSNLAEGNGRKRKGEFAYSVRVSRGSLCELETQMLLASSLGYMSGESMNGIDARIQRVGRLLNGLLRYLDRDLAKK